MFLRNYKEFCDKCLPGNHSSQVSCLCSNISLEELKKQYYQNQRKIERQKDKYNFKVSKILLL